MIIQQLYARLANDPSTTKSLFTGDFTGVSSVTLTLSQSAEGIANLAIFENNVEKVSKRVAKGGSVSWSPQPSSVVAFYVNYYDANDLPTTSAIIS